MDKNKDGVVTLEEFVLACQEVGIALYLSCPLLKIAAFMRLFTPTTRDRAAELNFAVEWCLMPLFSAPMAPLISLQDETMMRSMQLFENVM